MYDITNTLFSRPTFVQMLVQYIASEEHPWYSISASLIILLLLSCSVIFVLFGVYNRYFHALRHIPGPFWGSVTDLYKFCALLSQDVSQFSLELHQKYGSLRFQLLGR